MKLKLTEQQALNLLSKFGSPESLIGNRNIDPKEIERLAPNLTRLFKSFGGINTPATQTPSILDKGKGMLANITKDKKIFAKNIPVAKNEMLHPLGKKMPISSEFGLRNVKSGSKNHKGVDISTPSGSPVYAPLDGVVSAARDTTPNACGGFIQLNHTSVHTKFCHLSRISVRAGDQVKRGQLIGYSGGGKNDPMRGRATGPHLHYEILNTGLIAMNPVSVQSNLA
jgi:murein DD-endopeptidase MepM/ murein hydrolase activator NlpD